jgi:hypothetical protein
MREHHQHSPCTTQIGGEELLKLPHPGHHGQPGGRQRYLRLVSDGIDTQNY